MNKYLLFSGRDYYPSGGALDLMGAFPDLESAEAAYWWGAKGEYGERRGAEFGSWGHILSLESMSVVKELPEGEAIPFDRMYSKQEIEADRERHKAWAERVEAKAVKSSINLLSVAFDSVLADRQQGVDSPNNS